MEPAKFQEERERPETIGRVRRAITGLREFIARRSVCTFHKTIIRWGLSIFSLVCDALAGGQVASDV